MKLTEWRDQVENDKGYSEAREALELNFNLANAVLDARIKKSWTQDQLAKAIGTKQANISRIESGLGNPTLEFINRLTSVLEIKLNFSCEKKPEIQYLNGQEEKTTTVKYVYVSPIEMIAYDFSSKTSKTRETKVRV